MSSISPSKTAAAVQHDAPKPKKKPYPMYLGGLAASVAAVATHPLDLAKVRMQTSHQTSMFKTLVMSVKADGIRRGAYTGLSASLLRQMTYSMTRFAVYEKVKDQLAGDSKSPALWKLAVAGSAAGAAGGLAGNPSDIVLVRMISDVTKEPAKRFAYRNAIDGVIQITRNEGAASLFRGLGPNTARAVLMNASQLATYDFFKGFLLKTGYFSDGLGTHFTAGLCAGTVATTITSPADVLKSRIMSSNKNRGVFAVVRHSFANEGISWMFRGYVPAWIRLAPNSLVIFLVLEQLRKLVDASRANASNASTA